MAATVQGRISVARDDGVKLEDQENWFNFGKRYKGKTDFHGGQQVEIEYVDWQPDEGGPVRWYINKIKVVGNTASVVQPATAIFNGQPSRELLIMRESVLKTAVEFLGLQNKARAQNGEAHPEIPSSGTLLHLAEDLEAWCLAEGRDPLPDEPPPPDEPPVD